jgi:hypothetical protein
VKIFKDKWAVSQCSLQDAEMKIVKLEEEFKKTVSAWKKNLNKEKEKICNLEKKIIELTPDVENVRSVSFSFIHLTVHFYQF